MSELSTSFQQRFLRLRLRAGQSFASVRRPQRLQPQHASTQKRGREVRVKEKEKQKESKIGNREKY